MIRNIDYIHIHMIDFRKTTYIYVVLVHRHRTGMISVEDALKVSRSALARSC